MNQGLYTYYYIHFEEYPPEIADAERTGVQPLFEIYPPADLRETSHLERGWVQRVWPSSYGGHNARLAFHSNPLHEAVAEATLPLPQAPIPTPQASGGGRL